MTTFVNSYLCSKWGSWETRASTGLPTKFQIWRRQKENWLVLQKSTNQVHYWLERSPVKTMAILPWIRNSFSYNGIQSSRTLDFSKIQITRTKKRFSEVLKPWQNEETCCQKHLLRTHASPNVSHLLLLHGKNIFPCGKTVKHWPRNTCP